MIRKALLLKLFDAAYMQRWNDKIRPVELIELDKSGKIFTNPSDKRTEQYITGRFG